MSSTIRPNTILDLDNASSSYVNSEIDNYDWTKIYDTTYGSGIFFPPEPPSLNFQSSDISNFYDWRNAYLCIKFQIVKPQVVNEFTTCRSDPIRELIRKATFSINDTVIADCDHIGKYAVMDRACYSKQFYETSSREWLVYDEDVDTADFPPSDHQITGGAGATQVRLPMGNAKWAAATQVPQQTPPLLDPTCPEYNPYDAITGAAAPPYWYQDLHTGVGKLYRLTNAYTRTSGAGAVPQILVNNQFGSIVEARIPLMCIFRFFAYLQCVLKNTIFKFRFELLGSTQQDRKAKIWTLDPPGEVDTDIPDGKGFILRNAWIEVPRVQPSPSRLISLNNSLLNSPKIAISYPNYQVYRNPIAIGTTENEFLIQNVTERILRVTCFLQRERRDSQAVFHPWNAVCPQITEFALKINGISVPYSNMKNGWNSECFPYLSTISPNSITGDLNNCLCTSDAYRAYQEQCNNYYLYQPYNTKDGILTQFQGNGRLNPVQFATGSFYFTVDIARSRQSQEFLGGSASLTASFRFAQPTPEIYNCWSIVENSSLVDISLQERSAFVIIK